MGSGKRYANECVNELNDFFMPRYINKTKQGIGRAPEEIVFRGKQIQDNTSIRLIEFDEANVTQDSINELNQLEGCQDGERITWVNIDGLHDTDYLKKVNDFS